MPDLLTHVLVVYAAATLFAAHVTRVPQRFVPVAMAGAVVPDLSKVQLLVPDDAVAALLGVPFSWNPIHRLGGTLVLVGLAALAFERSERRVAAGFLLAGALSQYPLDGLIRRADGLSPSFLYPFSWWRPPAGGVYLSSDPWPVLPALAVAGAVWYVYGRRGDGGTGRGRE